MPNTPPALKSHALPIPTGLTLREAACLPETCFTVWSNMVMRGKLKAGERFLVHGGSSGIGTTAVQIASALGARVFATAGSDDKCRAVEALGAEACFNYKTADFVEEAKKLGGFDLILDMVGGPYLPRNVRALADDGRLVQIAFLQGPKVELNFAEMMMRRLTITGSTLRPQSDAAKAAHRASRRNPHLAADREGQIPRGDRQRISPDRSPRRTLADGILGPYRQDRDESAGVSSDNLAKIVILCAQISKPRA